MPEFHQGGLVVTVPPHFPTMHTRETCTMLAAFGLNEAQVAVILRCTTDDVRKYYAAEMEHGLTRINAQVMSALVHQALFNDDVAAMKLWLINKAGWRSGDGPRGLLPPPGNDGDGDGTLQVVERRTIIESVLTRVTKEKRSAEKVIDGRVVATQSAKPNGNGANGHGKNGSNGNGGGHK